MNSLDRLRAGGRRVRRQVAGEDGAALMIVLIALVGLTALAAAGMVITDTDLRVSQNLEASTNAFYAADAGLQEYLAKEDGSDTVSYTYAAGGTSVAGEQLLDLGDGRTLFEITSTSSYAPPEGGVAARNVSAVAIFASGTLTVPASFTAASGLLKNGGAGMISGQDWAPPGNPDCPDSPGDAVAGVAVPPSGYVQTGGNPVPDGDPPIDEESSSSALLENTGIDWESIVNGGITPDYLIPPDSWPDFISMASDEWPVIYVDSSYAVTPDENGRGMLIVRGNLEMNGDFAWQGVVLVGGYLTSNGYQTIEGATVTGLNALLGEPTPSSDIGNGNKVFKYHSCYLQMASQAALSGLAEVPGSWSESM